MATFDGAVKTKTRVPLGRDKFQPGMGTLVGSGQTEETHVHGTRTVTIDSAERHVNKNTLNHRVVGNHSYMCLANLTATIIGSKSETIMTNSTIMIFGVETRTQLGGYTATDIGPWSLVAQGFKNLLNPSSWMEVKTNSGTLVTSMNVSMGAINLQGFVQNTEMYAQQINVLGHDTLIKGIDTEAKMLKQRLAGMVNAIDGLEGSVQALKTQAGAVEAKAKPAEVGIIKLAVNSIAM